MRLATCTMVAAASMMAATPALAAPAPLPAGWSLPAPADAARTSVRAEGPGACTTDADCADQAMQAKSVRASATAHHRNKAMGSGILVAILAVAAVIAGIVVVSKSN